MNKNISDYKWVMLWMADVCSSLSDIYIWSDSINNAHIWMSIIRCYLDSISERTLTVDNKFGHVNL